MVRMEGLEPPRLAAPEPKSGVSTNFTTSAYALIHKNQFLSIFRMKMKELTLERSFQTLNQSFVILENQPYSSAD